MSSSKPVPFTANLSTLFLSDLRLFVSLASYMPAIVLPWRSLHKDDELAYGYGNMKALVVHCILFPVQAFLVLSIPFSAVVGLPLPFFQWTPAAILTVILVLEINKLFCRLILNGSSKRIFLGGSRFLLNPTAHISQWKYANQAHQKERWLFMNGVAVGSHWMDSNVERLASTFGRPILGIHNRTYGVVFDVLECVIQRTFGYPTKDIRTAYETVAGLLEDAGVEHVIIIAHSQGAIELGLVLDWIYMIMPADAVSKLEIYTFGNASNHWNCPMGAAGRLVKHTEHYVNEDEWVGEFGVLYCRQTRRDELISAATSASGTSASSRANATKQTTWVIENRMQERGRFVGRLFVRKASGHLLNQHYLSNMFSMNGEGTRVLESNPFMSAEIEGDLFANDDVVRETTLPHSDETSQNVERISDFSWLWKYRNGRVPSETDQTRDTAKSMKVMPHDAE